MSNLWKSWKSWKGGDACGEEQEAVPRGEEGLAPPEEEEATMTPRPEHVAILLLWIIAIPLSYRLLGNKVNENDQDSGILYEGKGPGPQGPAYHSQDRKNQESQRSQSGGQAAPARRRGRSRAVRSSPAGR